MITIAGMPLTHFETPRLVRRTSAPHLVLNVLIAFGATVLLVRLYLELTGYPRLGNSTLHIAHLLYGGIMLAAASLLMIIFATPSAIRAGAMLTGVGLGLFFDEVGKFITASNDYFYKPAASIIYLIALGIALLYSLLRQRAQKPTDHESMVAALENAELLMEGPQTEHQRLVIDQNLDQIAQTMADPDYVKLALALHEFADSEAVRPGRTRWQRYWGILERWSLRQFVRHYKALTIVMLALLAFNSLSSLLTFSIALVLPIFAPELAHQIQALYNAAGLREFSPLLLSITNLDLLLDFMAALITLIGIILFLTQRRQQGLYWIHLALFLQLCVVNVFTFYTEQFSAASLTLVNLGVLFFVRAYQNNLRQAATARQHLAQMASPGSIANSTGGVEAPAINNIE